MASEIVVIIAGAGNDRTEVLWSRDILGVSGG